MNKGKKKMKMGKNMKFKVKGPEAIEDGLMGMGRLIEAGGPWVHPEMERIPILLIAVLIGWCLIFALAWDTNAFAVMLWILFTIFKLCELCGQGR